MSRTLAARAILVAAVAAAIWILAVLVFNVIWYGAAIVSVLYFMVRPGADRRALTRATDWARAHSQGVTVLVFLVVGGYLLVDGLVGLLD